MNNAANDDMDVMIRDAFERTAVPNGAMNRCLASLRAAATDDASSHEVAESEPLLTTPITLAKAEAHPSRRRWFAFAASTALAASIALVSVAWLRSNTGLSTDSIIAGASSVAELGSTGQVDWQVDDLRWPAKADQELAIYDMQLEPISHATIPNHYFGSTRSNVLNIWKIRSHNSQRDGLWIEVDKTKPIDNLLSVMKPLTNSGKWSVAAMQVDGRLFVLVCQGDVSHFLRRTSFT